MSNMEGFPIEQLWYTWSDVGLSSIHAGFRIRAASPGLTEIYSERVKSMDRYMRYTLPPTTNSTAITPEAAPVGLAFMRTDWNNEYVLVHKNYSGKDGVGRPGNFFVHVLALGAYSAYFSVEDAIWLWEADFWKTNDQALDRRSNSLDTMRISIFDNNQRFSPQFMQVRNALPFIIEAYLSRRERTPLYIAAPAHQAATIAYLIAGLVYCLPKQLLADLTFSTYESDVTKATTEIVGTSWIATPGMEKEAVFSPQFYREKLAINCFTGEQSPLQKHPQTIYNPLAADFAAYATECLVTHNTDQLHDLCEQAEKSRKLQSASFLQLYSDEIANTDSIGIAEIERYLSDSDLCVDRLSSRNIRKKIIECAVANPQWSQSQLGTILYKLRLQAEREATNAPATLTPTMYATPTQQQTPTAGATQGLQKRSQRHRANAQTKKTQITLTSGLTLLAERAIPEIVDALKKARAARGTVSGQPGDAGIEKQKAEQATILIHLMSWCTPRQNSTDVWKQLFDKIIETRTATEYVKIHRDIDILLLELWNEAFPVDPAYDNVVRPLVIVPWQRLGKFLKTELRKRHRQWNIFAVENLTTDTSLTPQTTQILGKSYAREIDDLLTQLLQDGHIASAAAFLTRLVEKDYPKAALNDSSIRSLLTSLLADNQLWLAAQELVTALTRAGYTGNLDYQELLEKLLGVLITTAAGQDLLNLLVERGYLRKKQLVDLLLSAGGNLESSVMRVYRTAEEQHEFFLQEGQHYLKTAHHIQALLSLYQKLLYALPVARKLDRLFVLLSVALDEQTDASLDEKTIVQLLQQTQLDNNEQFRVLEQYGKLYLQECQQMPALANMLIEWFTRLPVQYNRCDLLFKLLSPQTDFQYQERLLAATPFSLLESRKFFKEFGHSKDYFPLFYRSPTILTRFTHFAWYANETAQDRQMVAEKTDLLFIWLDPSQSGSSLPGPVVKQFLEAAALSPEEQINFLEDYGDHYISTYPELPILMEYVDTYMQTFNTASLEQEGIMRFFTALLHQYKSLSLLNDKTQFHIQYWNIINSYCTTPICEQEALKKLATALYHKLLPDDAQLIAKLVHAFVSCIRTDSDLNNIVESMSQVQALKGRIPQLFYDIAEQAAANFRSSMIAEAFLPYIVFALTWSEGTPHFICVFLDTLLHYVNRTNLAAWKTLNHKVMQQQLSLDAREQWHFYLHNLKILDLLTVDKVEKIS